MASNGALVEVENLHMYFPIKAGIIRRKVADVKAVDGISFSIKRGETLGLVGETGCGKTTLGRCILRFYKITSGRVFFEGENISKFSSGKMRIMRRRMQMMFENPYNSLDPRMRVGDTIAEPLEAQHLARGKELKGQVAALLKSVQLEPYMAERFPHMFSGGQRQRVDIARALALKPIFVVCDNLVSHLDVSTQAQIINLLMELRKERNLTYLFIAHDLALVRNVSDRVAVMYAGKIVESAGCDELFENPLNPYTQALMAAVLIPDPKVERERKVIILPGEHPSPIDPPSGCRFHPRCDRAIDICQEQEPELRDVGGEHRVACHRV